MFMPAEADIQIHPVQKCGPIIAKFFEVSLLVHINHGNMAKQHTVTVVFIATGCQNFFQHFGLRRAVEVKLCCAVVFPVVIFMVFTHIQNYSKNLIIAQRDGVGIFLILAADVFVENFCVFALDLMVSAGINDGNLAFCDAMGQFIGQLGIFFRFHHGNQISQQDDEVRIITGCRRGNRCIHRLMDIADGNMIQTVSRRHRPEIIASGNRFARVAAEGAAIDHLFCAGGIAAGRIQNVLRNRDFMHLVHRTHGACVEIIIAFAVDFYPANG